MSVITALIIAWHVAGLANYIAVVLEHNTFDEESIPAKDWILIALICQFAGLALIPIAYWKMRNEYR